ncbi:1909_t:CDS:2, partial [Acaulospora morrowiae]
ISNTDIYLVCNDDIQLISLIVSSLRDKGSRRIHLLISTQQSQYIEESVGVNIIRGIWKDIQDYEMTIANAVIVISMLYHEFEKQEKLFSACVRKGVALFISWDSGMERESLIRDQACPRTQLHQILLDYKSHCTTFQAPHQVHSSTSHQIPYISTSSSAPRQVSRFSSSVERTQWILFQVGIFADEILKNDVSAVTTAFHSPKQFIFINVSVKSDFSKMIAEVIVNRRIHLNRNYVVGEFVSHTFLGHVYKVFNHGVAYDGSLPCEISEFEMSNLLRLSGIITSKPIPHILYPDWDIYVCKLSMEISLQHEAIIYKLLNNHQKITLRHWISQITNERSEEGQHSVRDMDI